MNPPEGKAMGETIAAEALDWLIRLRFDDVGGETLSAWTLWLEKPGAREAYDAALEAWSLGGLASTRRATEEELHNDRYDPSIPVALWRGRKTSSHGWVWAAAAAVACVAVGAAGWTVWGQRAAEPLRSLATLRAEHRDTQLSDGSQVRMGGMSALNVKFSPGRRAVSLEHGEAQFQVAKDRSRPFVVSTPLAKITAADTNFNVDIDAGCIDLYVTEGTVKVDPHFDPAHGQSDGSAPLLDVKAGQRLHIDGVTKNVVLYEAGASPQRSWREGRLEYRDEPLISVIEDVNRYAVHPIRLSDQRLGKLTYTGTVILSAADSWVFGLAGAFPLSAKLQNGDIVLTPTLADGAQLGKRKSPPPSV